MLIEINNRNSFDVYYRALRFSDGLHSRPDQLEDSQSSIEIQVL